MQPEDIPRAAPPTIVLFGQEGGGQALTDELALDGFDVRLVSDLAMFGGADLIVFAHTSNRGAGLDALRALRQGQLAGSGARVLWISRADDTTDTLRAFEAGADDVIRAPFPYAELLGVNFNSQGSPDFNSECPSLGALRSLGAFECSRPTASARPRGARRPGGKTGKELCRR